MTADRRALAVRRFTPLPAIGGPHRLSSAAHRILGQWPETRARRQRRLCSDGDCQSVREAEKRHGYPQVPWVCTEYRPSSRKSRTKWVGGSAAATEGVESD